MMSHGPSFAASADCLLKNIALFDKISIKFHDRITYAKDTSGYSGHICSW